MGENCQRVKLNKYKMDPWELMKRFMMGPSDGYRDRMRPSENDENSQDLPHPDQPNQRRNFGVFSSPLEMEGFFQSTTRRDVETVWFWSLWQSWIFWQCQPWTGRSTFCSSRRL